jgi:biotin carboxyl carrier protein
MSLEFNIGKRTSKIEFMSKNKSFYTFLVDDKEFLVDVVSLGKGAYSILYENKSYSMQLIEGKDSKRYTVNTKNMAYELEIIDAESKYLRNKNKGGLDLSEKTIISPMPGKVVRIPVKVGDEVKSGDTLIVVSAMKMESEYKVKMDGVVKEIHVKEGDTVDGGQKLVTVD